MGSSLRHRKGRHDSYYQRAKNERFVARSIYKLEELDQRFRLFKRGLRVLDLGCFPGSWLQYSLSQVGREGRVTGLDRRLPQDVADSRLSLLEGDVLSIDIDDLSRSCSQYDLILSDMAPDTSGVPFSDQVRSVELLRRAFQIARTLGAPGSSFVAKVFMGEGLAEALQEIKAQYQRTKTVRPKATRKPSTELYIVAQRRL